jgi:hypothetical protein
MVPRAQSLYARSDRGAEVRIDWVCVYSPQLR